MRKKRDEGSRQRALGVHRHGTLFRDTPTISTQVRIPVKLARSSKEEHSNSRAALVSVPMAEGRHVDGGTDQVARSPCGLPIATILEGRHMSTVHVLLGAVRAARV